ncbi:hypothetical protein SLEP1_g24888 [Rubroshorea leprosula]|uniref:Uncharacterized protein n=1 Tax=Rubroshorea leprosula TaxID=152421 RepID=A0AAV5JGZ6_9ROSI|nr:hypothetical protein SLEP1_g24888 [Rubroshorea leprosula]
MLEMVGFNLCDALCLVFSTEDERSFCTSLFPFLIPIPIPIPSKLPLKSIKLFATGLPKKLKRGIPHPTG